MKFSKVFLVRCDMLLRRLSEDNRGQAILEAAFMLPILLLIVLGAIDLNFALVDKSGLNYVTQATANCAASGITGCNPKTMLNQNSGTWTKSQMPTCNPKGRTPDTLIESTTIDTNSNTVTVTASCNSVPLGPVIRGMTLTSIVTVPIVFNSSGQGCVGDPKKGACVPVKSSGGDQGGRRG